MDELLTRGVEEIIGRSQLETAIQSKRHLRIKFGVDPTRPDIHLGHAVLLHQLRQLQEMGHVIIFLVGDYTAKIGDPSGKSKTRPVLNDNEILTNAQTYLDQVGKILDVKRAEIRRNSEWLAKLDFAGFVKLASHISVAQLIEREDFKNRLASGQELALHELLYPLIQAYDSVMLEADVEFGGTDQRFNMLAGRALQKKFGQTPQAVWISKLLVGLDGAKKMSKSLDNYIAITDAPIDMYGKIMSLPDSLIAPYYELCTPVSRAVITELVKTLAEGVNPRDSKASLAREIVRLYHGETAALQAEDNWNQTFRDKQGPTQDQIETHRLARPAAVLELLQQVGVAISKGEARRLLAQNGVRLNNATITDETTMVKAGDQLQVGKRRFFKFTAR